MLEEYEVVRLRAQREGVPVPSGAEGTVLMVFPDAPPAYLIEFTDESGDSLGVFTMHEADLDRISSPQVG